jgi:hypothetical protein
MHARRSTGRYPQLGAPTKTVHACKVFVDASMPRGRDCTSVVHRCNFDLGVSMRAVRDRNPGGGACKFDLGASWCDLRERDWLQRPPRHPRAS